MRPDHSIVKQERDSKGRLAWKGLRRRRAHSNQRMFTAATQVGDVRDSLFVHAHTHTYTHTRDTQQPLDVYHCIFIQPFLQRVQRGVLLVISVPSPTRSDFPTQISLLMVSQMSPDILALPTSLLSIFVSGITLSLFMSLQQPTVNCRVT